MSKGVPSYRLHKPKGLAVVTLNGQDFYLGPYDSPGSRAEYDRLIGEWLANGRTLPSETSDWTINEILVRYLDHADEYYRRPDGSSTSEAECIRLSLRPIKKLYGHTLAREFTPTFLKACRAQMVDSGLCRNECNKRTRRIIRFFKWATENELVPPNVWHALKAVEGLKRGRSKARETEPVRPVSDADIDAVLTHVLPPVAAMIRLQRLTGMRPGEVVAMRWVDVDQIRNPWVYRPAHHKTAHHGHERTIMLGPKAQEILKTWLTDAPEDYLFSPAKSIQAKNAERRANRKTKVQPSQSNRRKKTPKRRPADRYEAHSYYYAIRRGCHKAGIVPWHPHQIRHTVATLIRQTDGLDAARAVLGHRSPQMTELYAELDLGKAAKVMAKSG